MASDEDYASFLEKANRDPSEGTVKYQSGGGEKIQFKTVDEGVDVPDVLQKVVRDSHYVSDADEPFEVVSLKLAGGAKGLVDEAAFAKLIGHPNPNDAEVSILDVAEWDVQGEYKEVVDAVRDAVKGADVRVYRVEKEGARVEYWVVGVTGGKMVGVKVLAIES